MKNEYITPSVRILKVFFEKQILVGSVNNEKLYEYEINLDDQPFIY